MMRHCYTIGCLVMLAVLGGCVERLLTVTSRPAGAIVYLNGQEVGATPLTREFTWYGTYEVVLRKSGYETFKGARRAKAPLYDWPPLDLAAEYLWPFTLEDHLCWHFDLEPYAAADPNDLIERAEELREETVGAEPEDG